MCILLFVVVDVDAYVCLLDVLLMYMFVCCCCSVRLRVVCVACCLALSFCTW